MPRLDLEEVPPRRDLEDEPSIDGEGDGTRRFQVAWGALGIDEEAARGRSSLEQRLASRRPRAAPSIPPPPAELPRLTVGSLLSDAELVLKTEIGDGGNGVVFAASQRSLGREVAVKRPVPEAQGDEARAALVQEARVTGSLEHPNVIPVHALGSDAHGQPVMVMRRVHGTPWGTLLREKRGPDDRPAGRASASGVSPIASGRAGGMGVSPIVSGNSLTVHLEIFLQVCNVVRFAHSRGVIHGDLKPDNVMLGAYGEIYVLDWGAAMSTRPNDPRGMPFVGDVRTVNGTPAYMAPEMAGVGAPISERTDVYLLGAILHEILMGAPPHKGESLYDIMKSAFVSRPFPYPPEIPRELAAICQKAMARKPTRRYAGADEMRRAVAEHLEHRASIALVVEASARLEQLVAVVAGQAPERGRAVYQLYAESRFGFQQALRIWPGNEEARAGMERALVAMVTFAVDAGDAQAAGLLSSQLEGPHAELRARLAALAERVRAEGVELTRLRDLARDLDADSASRPRRVFVAVSAALGAALVPLQLRLEGGTAPADRVAFALAMPVGFLVIAGIVAWFGRHRIFANRPSRVIVGAVFVAGTASLVNRGVTILLRGGSLAEAVAADLVILATVAAMIALSADRRFAVVAAWFLAIGVVAELVPAHAVLLFSLALLGLGLGKALAGRRGEPGGPDGGAFASGRPPGP
jgi:hypothetical protein